MFLSLRYEAVVRLLRDPERAEIYSPKAIKTRLSVPGDKSISHRAIMLASLAEGETAIHGLLWGEDVLATKHMFEAMGVKMRVMDDRLTISGVGLNGLTAPQHVLHAGNSGTTARLVLGVLAGQDFFSVLDGDDSLVRRPMARVVEPLRQMGARIEGREGGRYLPLAMHGIRPLKPIVYRLPVASAQVKSALLLAALYAGGESCIEETVPTRDHTERMLRTFGVPISSENGRICLQGGAEQRFVSPGTISVPGDFSSAAFWLALAVMHQDAEIIIENVGINPTRTGFLEVLQAMGAEIEVISVSSVEPTGGTLQGPAASSSALVGEPVANLMARTSTLNGTTVAGEIIPRLIDELPLLAIVATQAQGRTIVRDAEELKVKESDRIRDVAMRLQAMGASVLATDDGWIIDGPTPLKPAELPPSSDHRIAMAFSIAALIAKGDRPTILHAPSVAAVSYPSFFEVLKNF
ncbi:MAG: 3-phosphoshikimate 1-carboxyvinyltransferase [Candidatus Carbobacillus altaicus]|nr:3-phosphoshikimate 1-carboxyvinyltransferase [Candidatus Carbobacillus altaicus]